MAIQPSANFGVFVGGVIVQYDMNGLVCWDVSVDFIEKPNEFLMAMLLHILANDCAIKHIEGCK